jgi:hypothetical protein
MGLAASCNRLIQPVLHALQTHLMRRLCGSPVRTDMDSSSPSRRTNVIPSLCFSNSRGMYARNQSAHMCSLVSPVHPQKMHLRSPLLNGSFFITSADGTPGKANRLMTNSTRDDFTPQEAQRRFEATLRGALKASPQHREAPKKPVAQKKRRGPYARTSSASAGSGQP